MREQVNFSLIITCSIVCVILILFSASAYLYTNELVKKINTPRVNYSASQTIKEDQLKVYRGFTLIDQPNLAWFGVKSTGSMKPLIDESGFILAMNVTSNEELHIGDIISYNSIDGDYVMHRIIQINDDENGTYYVTKGDNNYQEDDEKVRLSQIVYKVVGVIY